MFVGIWLLVLSVNGNHWQELHPWDVPFVVLLFALLTDLMLAASECR